MSDTPNTPQALAAAIAELHEKANTAFVPVNVKNALELQVKFNSAVVETLGVAGLLPEDKPAEAPAA